MDGIFAWHESNGSWKEHELLIALARSLAPLFASLHPPT